MHENRHFLSYRKRFHDAENHVHMRTTSLWGVAAKMSSSHRVTDLGKNPVRISKDEAPTLLSVVGPLFISSLLFLSFSSLVRCVAFQSFSFCLLQLSQQARPPQEACLLLVVLVYFFSIFSLFVSSYIKVHVRSSSTDQRFRGLPGLVFGAGLNIASCHSLLLVLPLCLPFYFSSYIVLLRCTNECGSLEV